MRRGCVYRRAQAFWRWLHAQGIKEVSERELRGLMDVQGLATDRITKRQYEERLVLYGFLALKLRAGGNTYIVREAPADITQTTLNDIKLVASAFSRRDKARRPLQKVRNY